MGNVVILMDVGYIWVCTFVKAHQPFHIKHIHFTACKLYPNQLILKYG